MLNFSLYWVQLSWVGWFIDGAKIAETVTAAPDDELSKLPQQSVLEQMGLQSASEHRQCQLQCAEWRRKSIPRGRSMDHLYISYNWIPHLNKFKAE